MASIDAVADDWQRMSRYLVPPIKIIDNQFIRNYLMDLEMAKDSSFLWHLIPTQHLDPLH